MNEFSSKRRVNNIRDQQKLYDEVIEVLKTWKSEGKTSFRIDQLQRALQIGYTAVAMVVDRLEQENLVSSKNTNFERSILL